MILSITQEQLDKELAPKKAVPSIPQELQTTRGQRLTSLVDPDENTKLLQI